MHALTVATESEIIRPAIQLLNNNGENQMVNFNLTKTEISKIKKAAKHMKLSWRAIVARPAQSDLLLKCLRECEQIVRKAGCHSDFMELMTGCEMFADELRIKELEDEGMTRSDAQGILILEEMKNSAAR